MRIAFVYDLRDDYLAQGYSLEEVAEFDTRECVDGVAAGLEANGCVVDRVGDARRLAARLVAGERWDLVFSLAEGLRGRSREAQAASLCELFDQAYAFSDPLTLAATLDKGVAKALARDAGLPTAPFAVLESARDAASVQLPFPLFVKPVAEGTGKGCENASKVENRARLTSVAAELIERFRQPVIVETYLPGREFTVGVVGTGAAARVLGVMEVAFTRGENAYSFEAKEQFEALIESGDVALEIVRDSEARRAGDLALAAYRALGCRDAGRVDIRSDARRIPHFLEVNPLAGMHPTHSDLPILNGLAGREYRALIGDILSSAFARQGVIAAEGRAA